MTFTFLTGILKDGNEKRLIVRAQKARRQNSSFSSSLLLLLFLENAVRDRTGENDGGDFLSRRKNQARFAT